MHLSQGQECGKEREELESMKKFVESMGIIMDDRARNRDEEFHFHFPGTEAYGKAQNESPHARQLLEDDYPFHIRQINAHKLYERGFYGEGVVVGLVSTGVDVEHPAIKGSYRGTQEDGSFDHNYNYYDATTVTPRTPKDYVGIGTHNAGTMVGNNTEHIGIAPMVRIKGKTSVVSPRCSIVPLPRLLHSTSLFVCVTCFTSSKVHSMQGC